MSSLTQATRTQFRTQSRLARLNLDFSELLASPYPGVSIHLDDSNMYKFCLHLCPDSGPYKGLRLHFDVQLPDTWPSNPPRVQSSVSIDHPNVFGSWICCDLLKEFDQLPAGYTGGYTPALTLRGLFMQFLTFFSSERVEQDYGAWVTMGEAWEETRTKVHDRWITTTQRNWRWDTTCKNSSMFECTKCGYGYVLSHLVNANPTPGGRAKLQMLRNAAPPGFVRSITPKGDSSNEIRRKDLQVVRHTRQRTNLPPYMRPPTKCLLQRLNDDTLYEILSILPSESLLSFCAAYPRAHDLMNRCHILLLRELRCFFLHQPLVDCILGIGIHLDPSTHTPSSDFDWLSEQAFDVFRVRRSIRKQAFEFFLPLAFSRTHFARAATSIWTRLVMIDDEIQAVTPRRRFGVRPMRAHPYQAVRVIYQFMNNVVVSLVQSTKAVMDNNDSYNDANTDNATLLLASERAVVAYCQLYHLLVSLAASEPRILADATWKLRKFLAKPKMRSKAYVPDMGELIVMASLVMGCGSGLTWKYHLNGPLLEEVFVRNVRWTLQDYPELEVMEAGTSEYRLEKTFESAKTGLRLTMFQVAFLSAFVSAHVAAPTRLAESYGFPARANPSDTPLEQTMVAIIKGIYAVSSWAEFFERVDFSGGRRWNKEGCSQVLRDCVRKSEAAGYHFANRSMGALRDERRRKERAWLEARSRAILRKK